MGSSSLKTVVFFLCFLLIVFFSDSGASQGNCSVSRCDHLGPDVRFPFWLRGRQPDHCGYRGFQLSCEGNEIVMELPLSGKFLVKNINYHSQVVDIYDPNDCIFRPLLHQYLNLSASPFQFRQEDKVIQYAFFNCSTELTKGYEEGTQIHCLSVPGHPVYAFPSDYSLDYLSLSFCDKLKTLSLPPDGDIYYPYDLSNPDFHLSLSWITPLCRDCETKGRYCKLKSNNTGSQTECYGTLKPSSPAAKGTSTKLVVTGTTAGFFVLLITTVISIKLYHHRNLDKIEKENQVKIEKFLEDYKSLKPTRYSYVEIKKITNQFKNKLGQGGYGSVFKGKLSNEIPVAVKILNNSKGNGEEFINEVGTIGRIHHVNVVRLLGFCADGFRRALVYEFLSNESLEKFIFSGNAKNPSLSWEMLQDISIGTAKGIEYLHQGCDQRILHFDIKPHNILLDHNFNPKISDFGLAKLCSKNESIVSMTATRGTMGYIAPEVFSRNFGNVSYKSDVYSFGMVLLEMVGGRKNIDTRVENTSEVYFPEWAYNHLNQGEELEIRVGEDGDARIARKLTIVALWCIQWHPVDRPSMKVVIQMLEGDTESLIMPPNPFSSTTPLKSSVPIPKRHSLTELTIISEEE